MDQSYCQAGGVVFVYQGFEGKQDCQDGWARMTEIEKKQVKLSLLLYSDGHKFSSTLFTSVQKVTYLRLQIHVFVMDKTPTHALFTQHYISLAC